MPLREHEQILRFTFHKSERLCSQKAIDNLFKGGKSLNFYPFRFVYKAESNSNSDSAVHIAISVPKRNFKRAVKRNLIKRYIREAYRINKPHFNELLPQGLNLSIMLLYVSPEIIPSARIAEKLEQALPRLAERITKDCNTPAVSAD